MATISMNFDPYSEVSHKAYFVLRYILGCSLVKRLKPLGVDSQNNVLVARVPDLVGLLL